MSAVGGREHAGSEKFNADGTASVLLAVADNPKLLVGCTFTSLMGRHIEDAALDVWYMPKGCIALNAARLSTPHFTVQALCRWHSDSQTPLEPATLLADLTLGHQWSTMNGRTPILPEGYGRTELAAFAQTELGMAVCRGLVIPPPGAPPG